MPTKFSQFNVGGNLVAGDKVAGLRGGNNTLFNANAAPAPVPPFQTLLVGQVLASNSGYFFANAVPQIYTLPVLCPFGGIVTLVNIGPSTVTIAQNAGQQILFGNIFTTLGVGGSIVSVTQGDSVTLVCYAANSSFVLLGGAQGIWNIV